jgi:hypothetical protein
MRRWQAPKNIKSLGRLALFPSGGQPLQKTTAVGGGYNRACLTRRKQRGQGAVPGVTPKQLVLDCPGRDQTRHVGFIPSRIKNSRTGVKRWTIPMPPCHVQTGQQKHLVGVIIKSSLAEARGNLD